MPEIPTLVMRPGQIFKLENADTGEARMYKYTDEGYPTSFVGSSLLGIFPSPISLTPSSIIELNAQLSSLQRSKARNDREMCSWYNEKVTPIIREKMREFEDTFLSFDQHSFVFTVPLSLDDQIRVRQLRFLDMLGFSISNLRVQHYESDEEGAEDGFARASVSVPLTV
jgi:hypothetical protein